jgi:hypothetical protein
VTQADQFIDLDAVVRPDIRVQINEETYRLPGDPNAEILLRIGVLYQQIEQSDGEDIDGILDLREQLQETVHSLFALRQPDLDPADLTLSDRQILTLVNRLMAMYASSGEDEPVPPTSPTAPRQRKPRPSRPRQARTTAKKAPASSTS